MRILHIINSLNPLLGGTVECVRQVGGAMFADGHDVEVAVCKDLAYDPWVQQFPVKVHALGPGLGKFAYSPKLAPWLRANGHNYDVLIINGLWQYQGVCASRVAKDLGIPYFVYPHGMLDPWSRRAHPVKYLKKLAYWIIIEKKTLANAAGVFFTSEEEAKLAPMYFNSANWKGAVVGNGVAAAPSVSDEDMVHFRAKYEIRDERPYWLFLSRIHEKKGIDLLLEAYAEVSQKMQVPRLVIAGGGDAGYVASLKQLARRLEIEDRIVWTGPIYGVEKWAAFRMAELFVLPSHQENFGIVVAEALSVGLPVCTTRAVNIWREIESFGAGVICEDSHDSIAAALTGWTALSPDARQQYRANALSCFEAHFQIAQTATRLARLMNLGCG